MGYKNRCWQWESEHFVPDPDVLVILKLADDRTFVHNRIYNFPQLRAKWGSSNLDSLKLNLTF
jgi:hypothetical protein